MVSSRQQTAVAALLWQSNDNIPARRHAAGTGRMTASWLFNRTRLSTEVFPMRCLNVRSFKTGFHSKSHSPRITLMSKFSSLLNASFL
ncbi:hypothetical protein J6590_048409 [Homalodisca vitripennis]|nr:hypothetical protein J6590_048409 [Homalodisca vitripennis]